MTETEIGVECTSIDEWIAAGDQAHIVLMGDPTKLKFDYKVTGLEEDAKYSIELVFKPDLSYRFTRSYNSDGSWKFFCKEEDPPADGEKFTGTYTHRQEYQTGETWMKEPVDFNSIVFRTTREGELQKNRESKFRKKERRKNELYLEGRLKYQVAVRIRKEGVEEPVYEKDVPGQVFIACGSRSEHEEKMNSMKRKLKDGEEVQKKKKKRGDIDKSSEDDQPCSSGDIPGPSEPGASQDFTSAPEDQPSSSQDPVSIPELRLPSSDQAPPPAAIPMIIIQPPSPQPELHQRMFRMFRPLAPPPVEEDRPQIGSDQGSAFRKYSKPPP